MYCQLELFDYLDSTEADKPEVSQEELIYRVIKSSNMQVIRERNFVEICTDSRICISATVKLLKGNMVYWSEWYTYPFLNICNSEKEAEKCYKEHLDNILRDLYQPPRFEVNIPVELEDMYLCVNGIWSCFTYTDHNGAITIK